MASQPVTQKTSNTRRTISEEHLITKKKESTQRNIGSTDKEAETRGEKSEERRIHTDLSIKRLWLQEEKASFLPSVQGNFLLHAVKDDEDDNETSSDHLI